MAKYRNDIISKFLEETNTSSHLNEKLLQLSCNHHHETKESSETQFKFRDDFKIYKKNSKAKKYLQNKLPISIVFLENIDDNSLMMGFIYKSKGEYFFQDIEPVECCHKSDYEFAYWRIMEGSNRFKISKQRNSLETAGFLLPHIETDVNSPPTYAVITTDMHHLQADGRFS
jgi:hypothetical protein